MQKVPVNHELIITKEYFNNAFEKYFAMAVDRLKSVCEGAERLVDEADDLEHSKAASLSSSQPLKSFRL